MMKINKIILATAALFLAMNLTGCDGWYPFLYRAPLEQGNIPNPNAISQLKLGMTKDQVQTLMGTHLLQTPLSPDVWHYTYLMRIKGKVTERHQLTLYFTNNKLTKIV